MNDNLKTNSDTKQNCKSESCNHDHHSKVEGFKYSAYDYKDSTGRRETEEHFRDLTHPERNFDKSNFIPGKFDNQLDKDKEANQLGDKQLGDKQLGDKQACNSKCTMLHDKECSSFNK
jgi:hypothetical protein